MLLSAGNAANPIYFSSSFLVVVEFELRLPLAEQALYP
jgi:hypothetical protein